MNKIRKLNETSETRQERLKKEREMHKIRRSNESFEARQERLKKEREMHKIRKSNENSDTTQNRLAKRREHDSTCRLNESSEDKEARLERRRQLYKCRKPCKIQELEQVDLQQSYLKNFSSVDNGLIHDQCWAKENMKKFHKSLDEYFNKEQLHKNDINGYIISLIVRNDI